MPVYEYLCDECGAFTAIRPMAEYDLSNDCPKCGVSSRRVIMTPPQLSRLSQTGRTVSARNERSAHAPRTSAEMKSAHGAGCGCCGGKASQLPKGDKGGAKGFPTKRPWMISH